MPRYFFNVLNIGPDQDEIGEELPNDEAAWREAIAFAGAVFKDLDGKLRPGQGWALDVTDSDRNPLFSIRIDTKLLR
jgi:hypothetical protein